MKITLGELYILLDATIGAANAPLGSYREGLWRFSGDQQRKLADNIINRLNSVTLTIDELNESDDSAGARLCPKAEQTG